MPNAVKAASGEARAVFDTAGKKDRRALTPRSGNSARSWFHKGRGSVIGLLPEDTDLGDLEKKQSI